MTNNVVIANFNVTFGEMEEPLLDYFDILVYPAFKSDIKRYHRDKDSQDTDIYYFMDVQLIDLAEDEFVLTGKYIKETVLEVKSVVQNNQLIQKNDRYPAAPYSVFYIFLKNHRMVFIKNQKGSPDIRSFATTTRYILDQYRRIENKTRDEKLPISLVNVVGIPMREDLEKALEPVDKIEWLKLRFYPLNGDWEIEDLIESSSTNLRKIVEAKTGNIMLNSPESKAGIIQLLDAAQGIVDATMQVRNKNNTRSKINNDNISEQITWNLDEDSINDPKVMKNYLMELKSINHVSKSNKAIYDSKKKTLRRLAKS
jgi:hypothetical protein